MRSQVRSGARWRRTAITVAVVVVGLIVVGRITGVLVDWLWFSSIGYVDVFWTVLSAQALLFVVVFAVSAGAIWVSGLVAHRYARTLRPSQASAAFSFGPSTAISELADRVAPRIRWRSAITGVAIVLGLLIAIGEISSWDMALRFIHQVPFGERDPIFGKDIGFYLFSLPAYIALKNWLLKLLFCSAVVAGAVYGVRGDIDLEYSPRGLSPAAAAHGSALLGLFFVVKAWSYGLDRFLLLYGDNGVVVGAGYTDLNVRLPILWLLIGL